tara:strand:+ start:947 stop:1138 length:192 start_codon:yes stop_codon:yes gene_type:complete
MFEKIEFQGKLWRVIDKVEGHRLDDPSTLKENYGADLVLKNNQNVYFVLEQIIDAEFEEIKNG